MSPNQTCELKIYQNQIIQFISYQVDIIFLLTASSIRYKLNDIHLDGSWIRRQRIRARISSANTFPSASCSDTTTGCRRSETLSTILRASSVGIISVFSLLPQQPSISSLFDRETTGHLKFQYERSERRSGKLTACLVIRLDLTFIWKIRFEPVFLNLNRGKLEPI